MSYIITLGWFLGILDTLIGNRIFPGKVEVFKTGNDYYVTKINRLFFIPIRMYVEWSFINRIMFSDFTINFDDKYNFTNPTEARLIAKLLSNYSNSGAKKNKNRTVVWSSTESKKKKDTDDFLYELGQELINKKVPVELPKE